MAGPSAGARLADAGTARAPAASRSWPGAALGPETLLLGAVGTAALAACLRPVDDPDYWMHVRVGQWILDHRRLPDHDLFSYTVPGHRWVDPEYLSQVLMWLLHVSFGPTGVSVAFGVLTLAGLLLAVAAAHPRRQPYVIVGLGLALGVVAGMVVWGPRPQMVTFFMVALEALWLRRSIEGCGRAIFFLPALMALWGNLHGGWPVGLLLLGVALVAELLRWLADPARREHLRQARRLAIVGVLSAAAVAVNPNGLAVYAYPFATVASGVQQDLIAEWMSPDFHLAALRGFEAMLLLVVAGLRVGRPALLDVLLVLTGAVLALESVRNIALFVAVATPVLITTWSDAWRRFEASGRWTIRPVAPARWMPAATVALLALVAGVVLTRVAADLASQPALVRRTLPVGAADWLAAHPDVGTRMFNQYTYGDYLAYRFYPDPRRRVFVFSEGEVMGDQQLLRYDQVMSLRPGWRETLDRFGVDYVVVGRGCALDDVLGGQPGWRRVYGDSTAVVYVRTGAAASPPPLPGGGGPQGRRGALRRAVG